VAAHTDRRICLKRLTSEGKKEFKSHRHYIFPQELKFLPRGGFSIAFHISGGKKILSQKAEKTTRARRWQATLNAAA
jgi:hypothetical protein